ncbi:MAG: NAD(P)H-dependent oxidoreductase [Victivallaceae bacterium]|nr:NAD(P)H-dependent oxidoreductase [Victivallaceae bacterium]
MKIAEIIRTFQFRHACKEFDETRKISEENFACILEAGRLSPSSFGFEPWHFVVVQDTKLREELVPVFWGGTRQFPTASHLVLTLARKGWFMRYDRPYLEHIMRDVEQLPPDVLEQRKVFVKHFQEHDFELLGSERAMTDWSIHQTYIALANMMTVAAMLGIDSCPMEGFYRREIDRELAEKINMDPQKYTLAYAVAFGYRKKEPRPKTRQQLSDIVTWISSADDAHNNNDLS